MAFVVPIRLRIDSTERKGTVVLSAEWSRRLGIRDGAGAVLTFGRARTPVTVRVAGMAGAPSDTLVVSAPVAEKLRMPAGLEVDLKVTPPPTGGTAPPKLELGPLVGVLVRRPWSESNGCMEGARSERVEPFCFRIGDVDWKRRAVIGYRPGATGWQRWTYPLPHVIYDRSCGRWAAENKGAFFRRMARLGTVAFNGAVGYKWTLHQRLWRFPRLRPHIPPTRLTRRPGTVLSLVARWGGVFVKPSEGHKGQGIVRVRKLPSGRYLLTRSTHPNDYEVGRKQLTRLLAALFRRAPYLAQREIRLARLDGAVWDVRALVGRDATGEWYVAGLAARLGKPHRIVSNLHQGAKPTPLAPILEALFPNRAAALLDEIRTISLQVARAVQSFAPRAGELGIDLGVDLEGKVWLIEVNPKPGRQSFLALNPVEAHRDFYALPFRYARYLARFGPAKALEPPAGFRSEPVRVQALP